MRAVTIEKAAEEIGITPNALSHKVKAGLIPSYRPFGGRSTYLDMDEVNELLLTGRRKTTAEMQAEAQKVVEELKKNQKRKDA